MIFYKFTCPVCSEVITTGAVRKGPSPIAANDPSPISANHSRNMDEDKTYEVIQNGDGRLCAWDDMSDSVEVALLLHLYRYNKRNGHHAPLMLKPTQTDISKAVFPYIKMEHSRLAIGSTNQKSLDQCPVTILYLLNISYIFTRWSPPSNTFNANAILRIKKHLADWGSITLAKDKMQSLMLLAMQEFECFVTGKPHPTTSTIQGGKDMALVKQNILTIVKTVSNRLDSNSFDTIFANIFQPDENNFQPDEFVPYMRNILSTAVKEVLPCPADEMKDFFKVQMDEFTLMIASHLKCIAQYKAST